MFKKLLGDPNARKLKKLQPLVAEVNLIEEDIKNLPDDQLRGKTTEFRQMLDKAKNYRQREDILEEILPEAFAVVREAATRVLGMRSLRCPSTRRNRTA
jgi:preprotein translocase subunit SecA